MNQRRLHAILTIVWAAAVVPTMLWWKDSIMWVGLMSCYANLVGHWGAYQAARVERGERDRTDSTEVS